MSSTGHGVSDVVDVVIVGAGVMGCAVALRLASRGLAVTVIERGIPGAEASSAAAGILGPQMEADAPGPLLDLGLRSRALYPALAAELRDTTGIDIGYEKSGVLAVALDGAGAAELTARRAWQMSRGLRVEPLSPEALRAIEPNIGPDVRAALRFTDDAQVSARELARALSQAAAHAGARFLQGRYVRRVVVKGGVAQGVELDGEVLAAGAVVVAAGSWSGLIEGAGVPSTVVRPARGQLVSIETRPPLFRHVISVHGRGYLVPRRDGTVIAGSTVEMAGFRKEVTVGGLAQILGLAATLVPALADAPVTGSWSNFRPYTEDHLPVLGQTPVRGLVLATGHFRNGILLAPVTADAIASLVATGVSEIDLAPFSVARFGRAD
ncbi:MAG TPA: glycine oxidase ThiO [Polyangia bacterium]|jgi:glycine oxidase|nr:glycine oxidase ThiO [Polyangia bacterium]